MENWSYYLLCYSYSSINWEYSCLRGYRTSCFWILSSFLHLLKLFLKEIYVRFSGFLKNSGLPSLLVTKIHNASIDSQLYRRYYHHYISCIPYLCFEKTHKKFPNVKNLARVQQQFLVQLMIQTLVPFIIMLAPMKMPVIIEVFYLFGYIDELGNQKNLARIEKLSFGLIACYESNIAMNISFVYSPLNKTSFFSRHLFNLHQ